MSLSVYFALVGKPVLIGLFILFAFSAIEWAIKKILGGK